MVDEIKNEQCPVCNEKALTLREEEKDIPYFGKVFIFSMKCEKCGFSKADVECAETKDPTSYTIEVNSEKDMQIRVVKSSEATVKIPQMRMSMTPGPISEGFVTNIEGILDRFKAIIEQERDESEDPEVKKHAKNLLKKIWKIKLGDIPLKIVIEDPTGNSAIISDKAKVEKLKVAKTK